MATKNIVPRADNEGSLGTSSKKWGDVQTTLLNGATVPSADSTSPTTQAMGDSAAAGSSAKYARVDHKHAMPSLGYGLTNNSTPAVSLTTSQVFLSTPTAISAATYADVGELTLTLAAGTWLVLAMVYGSAANLAFLMHCAITDGSNVVIQEGSQFTPASGTASVHAWGSVALSAIVTPGGSTTYKVRAARGLTTLTNTWTAQDGAGTNTTNNASDATNLGSSMRAIRVV